MQCQNIQRALYNLNVCVGGGGGEDSSPQPSRAIEKEIKVKKGKEKEKQTGGRGLKCRDVTQNCSVKIFKELCRYCTI